MKKMSKMGKSILLSSLAIIAFGGIAAGTTYALFTSDATTNVSVTTGKVKVTQTVNIKECYSPTEIDTDGTITDSNNAAKNNTFANGGSATLNDNGTVTITNMTPGDKVTLTVTPTNESNVKIKYRETYSIEGETTNELDVSGDMVNLWTPLDENGTINPYDVTIELPASATGQDVKDVTITLKVEAVQGNAKVAEAEYATTNTAEEFANKIATVADGSTVEFKSTSADDSSLNLTNTLNIDKSMNIIVDSDINAPAGKSAIEVTKGKTVTLSAATVSDKGGKNSRIRYANNDSTTESLPTIKSTGGTTVVADGTGSKVIIDGIKIENTGGNGVSAINGGEVVIEDGSKVEAQEVAALAYKKGTITINGGTFETKDNFVVGTNGTKDWGGNTITINGGVFNGNIQSKNYIACGVYVANSDTVNITGGTFNIKDGCGVLARSGNTTVSDSVKFEFTSSSEEANEKITDGWVGDTKILVPTGKAVVKDLIASYPGGTPTVTYNGTERVTELKSIDVTSETEFTNAISNTEVPKNIHIKNDITLPNRVTIQSKNTIIYGDGNVKLTAKDQRVLNVFGDNDNGSYPIVNQGSLTIIGVNIKAEKDDSVATNYSRAINIYGTNDYSLTLDDVDVESGHYGVVDIENTNLHINAKKNTTITAYGCYYQYVNGNATEKVNSTTADFNNCTLNGWNVFEYSEPSNSFCNIYLGGVKGAKATNKLNFNNCTFVMRSTDGNKQRILTSESSGSNVTMTKCQFYFDEGNDHSRVEITDYSNYLNLDANSTVTIDGEKYPEN